MPHIVFRTRYAFAAVVLLLLPLALSHHESFGLSNPLLSYGVSARNDHELNGGLMGPRWITMTLPGQLEIARHRAVMVEPVFGENLCIIGGDTKRGTCYPLGTNGIPNGNKSVFDLDEALRFHAATAVENRIFVLGGYINETARLTNSIYCVSYNDDTKQWIPVRVGDMNKGIMLHAAVTVGDWIYIIGGYDGKEYLKDVVSLRVKPGCTQIKPADWGSGLSSLLFPVAGHAAVSVVLENGRKFIYVIGGLPGNHENPINRVQRAEVLPNGQLSDWKEAIGAAKEMSGMWLLAAMALGRNLYVAGGTTTETASDAVKEVYHAQIHDDGEIDPFDSAGHLPVAVCAHASATSRLGFIYIVGGMNHTGLLNDAYFSYVPLLDFEKYSAPHGPVTYGDTISFTLRLANKGARDFPNLTITDTVQTSDPARLEFYELASVCQPFLYAGDTMTCPIPGLAIGEVKTITYRVAISLPVSMPPSGPQYCWPSSLDRDMSSSSGKYQTECTQVSDALSPSAGPDVGVLKSGFQPIAVAGRWFTYSLIVGNFGPSLASNVILTDILPSDAVYGWATPPPDTLNPPRWFWGSIPADSRYKKEITLTVWITPSSANILTNTALVSSNKSDPNPDNNRALEWTVVVRQADLKISKHDSEDPVIAGRRLTYTLAVSNTGPSDAQGVILTDTLPGGVSFLTATLSPLSGSDPLAWELDLAAGHTRTIQIVTAVDDDSKGTLCNHAGVSSSIDPSPGNNIATECTGIYTLADLIVKKTSVPEHLAVAGERLTYTLIVTNAGPSKAMTVTITDSLPAGTFLVNAVPTPTSMLSDVIVWYISELEQDEDRKFIIVVDVGSGMTGTLVNEAEVRSDVPDSRLEDNKVKHWIAINSLADLRTEKARSPELVIAGTMVTYVLSVCNDGPSNAVDVWVQDQIPANTRPTDVVPSPAITTSGWITWYISLLQTDRCEEFRLVLRVDSSATGILLNRARVKSGTPDRDPGNNMSEDYAIVYSLADLGVDKYDDPDRVVSGDTLQYSLHVSNSGPSDARNVVITDRLPSGVTLPFPPCSGVGDDSFTCYTDTLAAGAVWTISALVKVKPSAHGLLINEACVQSSVPDNDPSNNCDEEQTKAPILVTSMAYVCEHTLWCLASNRVINSQFMVYLPILLKTE